MRKAVVAFAVGTTVSAALFGFALRYGLQSVQPGLDEEWPGWQVDAARWSCIGAALLLGLVASVFTFRRLRLLQGEGLVLGGPLLLTGLLLSGALSPVADAAQGWAAHRTEAYHDFVAEQAAYAAENKLHPVPVPMHNFPAPPAELAALLPTVDELGPGWFVGQRPAIVGAKDGREARTHFQKATRTKDGWDFDRVLWVRLHEYASAAEAATAMTASEPGPNRGAPVVRYAPLRIGGVVFSQHTSERGSVFAYARQGARVWNVALSSGQPDEPLSTSERDVVLRAVAARIAGSER